MKKQVDTVDATPSKRLYLSIIADYDLNRSVCELVDNALDVWVRKNRSDPVVVRINLDRQQQSISITDDAGGLKKEELSYVVGPGQTGTEPSQETIGIFGVGTKRAVVALASDVRIKTRFNRKETYQVEFDDDWLKEDDDWELPVFEVDRIEEGTTIVELSKLRVNITDDAVKQLKAHLEATYANFIKAKRLTLKVNEVALKPMFFENWAYPPKYEPRHYSGKLDTSEFGSVRVEVVAGLTRESSPAGGEYGVYFYCNDRLVARAMKTFEVGFERGQAGLPHPKLALTRVLVSLNGDARAMPWNSSKSDIDAKHVVFLAIHTWLVQVVKDYASLSRIWVGDWPEKVFKHASGKIQKVSIESFPVATKSYLPPMPKSRPRFGDRIAHENKAVALAKPWTQGLYEGVVAAVLISKQRLEQRNRIALIVLDSTLEIAFKEYLVNDSGVHYSASKLQAIFEKRHLVHTEIKKYITLDATTWKKINYYYRLRCDLIHKQATTAIPDPAISDFRKIVEKVLKKVYSLRFS